MLQLKVLTLFRDRKLRHKVSSISFISEMSSRSDLNIPATEPQAPPSPEKHTPTAAAVGVEQQLTLVAFAQG